MSAKRFFMVFCLMVVLLALLGCEKGENYTGTAVDVVVVFMKLNKQPACPTPADCLPNWGPNELAKLGNPRHSASDYVAILTKEVNAYYQKATFGQVYFKFHLVSNPSSSDGWWDAPHALWEYIKGVDTRRDGAVLAYGAIGDKLADFGHLLVIMDYPGRGGQTCCVHYPTPYYAVPDNYVIDGKSFPMIAAGVSEDVDDDSMITVVSHELGHELGAPDQYQDGTGSFTGMGPYDLMGYDSYFNHFGAWTKLDRKWISWTGNTTQMPCLTGQCEITTTLDPLEHQGNNALLIPYTSGAEFLGLMAECRQRINGDENIPEKGVLLTQINPYLDQNWQIAIAQVKSITNNFMTAVLEPGDVYLDGQRNIRVTNLSNPGDDKCTVKAERIYGATFAPDPLILQAPEKEWGSQTLYRSPDIWIDSPKNGQDIYPDSQKTEWVKAVNGYFNIPEGGGDPIWPNEVNRVMFRIRNGGTGAAKAEDIVVNVYVRQPLTFSVQNPNCGADSNLPYAKPVTLPKLLGKVTIKQLDPNQSFVGTVSWTPDSSQPAEIEVTIDEYPDETSTENNTAYETFVSFHHDSLSISDKSLEVGTFQMTLPLDCEWGVPFKVLPLFGAEGPGDDPWKITAEPAAGFIQPGETIPVRIFAAPPDNGKPGDCTTAAVGAFFPINDVFASVGGFSFDACVTAATTPTTVPQFTPTSVPTTVPTLTPTPVPTTVPTLTPTPVPTFTPTPVSTPTPTPVPITPTPIPVCSQYTDKASCEAAGCKWKIPPIGGGTCVPK